MEDSWKILLPCLQCSLSWWKWWEGKHSHYQEHQQPHWLHEKGVIPYWIYDNALLAFWIMKTRNFYTSEHLGQYSSIKEIGRKIHNTKPFQQLIIKLSIFLLLYLLKLKLLSNADKASGNWKHQEPHITDKKINKWCSHKQHSNSVFKLKFKSYKNLRCEVSKIIF